MLAYHNTIYLCSRFSDLISIMTYNPDSTDPTIIKKSTNLTTSQPFGIDLDQEKSVLYVAEMDKMSILNIETLERISSWDLPMEGDRGVLRSTYHSFRGLKVDKNNLLYLTIDGLNSIYQCQKSDGKKIQTWGTDGSGPCQFNKPYGITLNNIYIYICDAYNKRVQILTKEDGKFITQWGDRTTFTYPSSIFYDKENEMFYIGCCRAVQLFNKEGKRLQELESGTHGNFVYSTCVMDDHLYVCDYTRKRIQIFKRDAEGDF